MTGNLRVLFVAVPPAGISANNGVQRYTQWLVTQLGDRVDYTFTPASNDLVRPTVASQASSSDRKSSRFVRVLGGVRLLIGYVGETLRLMIMIRRVSKKVDIVHVNRIGCEVDAIAARLASRCPVVGTVHNLPGIDERARHPVRRLVEWFSLRAAHHLIAVSQQTRDEWVERVGVGPDKFTVIYNGMEPPRDICPRDEARARFGVANNVFCIGICARLHRMKGHGVLFNALFALRKAESRSFFAKTTTDKRSRVEIGGECSGKGNTKAQRLEGVRVALDTAQTEDGRQKTEDDFIVTTKTRRHEGLGRECGTLDVGRGEIESFEHRLVRRSTEGGTSNEERRTKNESILQPSTFNLQPEHLLLIAGEGPLEVELRRQVVDLGLEDCVRFVGHVDDPLVFFRALDVQVLPSVELECLPYSIVEGMHVGVPSIVSDVGGAKEIIGASGGGTVVCSGDVGGLADTIREYASDRERCAQEGAAALAFAREHLTAEKMAQQTQGVYWRLTA